jgi:NADPH:quinone reductase-like Zn-dependent oxidoreductase
MPKAAVIHEKGGPENFRFEEISVGDPGPGEVRLRHTAIGVNYADTYHRGGVPHPWPVGDPPVVVGFEATGEVMSVGPRVEGFRAGDKVVYGLPPLGAYAEERLYPTDTLLHMPDGIDPVGLAGIFMKGVTAYYLLHKTYAVRPGDWVLVHAAAGGMGHVLVPGPSTSAPTSSAPSGRRPRRKSRAASAATTLSTTPAAISPPSAAPSAAAKACTSSMRRSARRR